MRHGAVKLAGRGLLADDLGVRSRDQYVTLDANLGLDGDRGLVHLVLDLTPAQSAELRKLLADAEQKASAWRRAVR